MVVFEPEGEQKGLYGLNYSDDDGETWGEGVVRMGLNDALEWLSCMERLMP
jgi:hypothetical protein